MVLDEAEFFAVETLKALVQHDVLEEGALVFYAPRAGAAAEFAKLVEKHAGFSTPVVKADAGGEARFVAATYVHRDPSRSISLLPVGAPRRPDLA